MFTKGYAKSVPESGLSLSQYFLSPDLLNKWIWVLFRVRQFKYAITIDIDAQYYQVKIPKVDWMILDFFGMTKMYRKSTECQLICLVACGAAAAVLLLRYAPLPTSCAASPLIADTIYVDVDDVNSLDDARMVIHDTKETVSYRGFNLTSYTLNYDKLLQKSTWMIRLEVWKG